MIKYISIFIFSISVSFGQVVATTSYNNPNSNTFHRSIMLYLRKPIHYGIQNQPTTNNRHKILF
jgi:hypothetical protein